MWRWVRWTHRTTHGEHAHCQGTAGARGPWRRMWPMATVGEWIEGARLRTLPNAVAPVTAGVGAASALDAFSWWRSLLALLVALALIIGVNFANDYSDGIRGTDENRVGPLRLVGSGPAKPKAVPAPARG